MIDTLNGGQTCRQCRRFKSEVIRRDPLFGKLTEHDWCIVKGKHIENVQEGQDCLMFLRTAFTDNHSETRSEKR